MLFYLDSFSGYATALTEYIGKWMGKVSVDPLQSYVVQYRYAFMYIDGISMYQLFHPKPPSHKPSTASCFYWYFLINKTGILIHNGMTIILPSRSVNSIFFTCWNDSILLIIKYSLMMDNWRYFRNLHIMLIMVVLSHSGFSWRKSIGKFVSLFELTI